MELNGQLDGESVSYVGIGTLDWREFRKGSHVIGLPNL